MMYISEIDRVGAESPYPALELDMQELEDMEAPGFWTGFEIGLGIVGGVVGSALLYTAVSALT